MTLKKVPYHKIMSQKLTIEGTAKQSVKKNYTD
jgi:hypothetical protein